MSSTTVQSASTCCRWQKDQGTRTRNSQRTAQKDRAKDPGPRAEQNQKLSQKAKEEAKGKETRASVAEDPMSQSSSLGKRCRQRTTTGSAGPTTCPMVARKRLLVAHVIEACMSAQSLAVSRHIACRNITVRDKQRS